MFESHSLAEKSGVVYDTSDKPKTPSPLFEEFSTIKERVNNAPKPRAKCVVGTSHQTISSETLETSIDSNLNNKVT